MKRLILLSTLTLLLVLIIGSSAFATLGRIRALGNADYYFKDIYHIYMNPAYLGQYTNSVYGELGTYYYWMEEDDTPYDQFLGINYKVYKGLSLGLTLNRVAYWDVSDLFDEFEVGIPEPINEFDFMASYDFEKLHIGASLYHAGNIREEEYDYEDTLADPNYTYTSNWEASSGTTALTAGFLFDLNENSNIEAMFKLNFDRGKYKYDYSNSTGTSYFYNLETDGGNGIEFGARAFFGVIENFQLVPLFAFGTESIFLKYADEDTSYSTGDLKMSYFVVGLGGNLKLDKGMVAGGINVSQYKWTDETDREYPYEYKDWYMPGFNLGVEYDLTKWLVARIGMEKEFGRTEYKYDDLLPPYLYHDVYKYRWTTDDHDFIGMGVGFKFSKFKVDATVGEDNFFEGGYILSGKQNNMFGTLSATFEF